MQSIKTKVIDSYGVTPSRGVYATYIKRCLDLILSLIAAIILLPFHFMIIILIKITMPGSVLFKQERLGRNGKTFNILKFRTMRLDTQAVKEYDSTKDLERITYLGKFLRRTKLDETMQVYNILKGDMSIVGPRPTVVRAIIEHNINMRRLEVNPGLTGLAQINGNVKLTWQERVVYDIEYINTLSFWLDCKIILKTVLVVLFGEDRFTITPIKNNK